MLGRAFGLVCRSHDRSPQGHTHGKSGGDMRPVVSSMPSIRLAFWSACPEEPLHRLSRTETTSVRPEILSPTTPRWQKFDPCTWARAGSSPNEIGRAHV